jgi:nucleotide-binding universal stress UspA family protein
VTSDPEHELARLERLGATEHRAEVHGRGYRIVVGVGFSDACKHAVHDALQIATRLPGAELHMTTVLDREHLDRASALATGYAHLIDTELRLVSFVKDVGSTTPLLPASLPLVFHVRIGEIAAALTQVAFDVDARLIVVGSRDAPRVTKMLVRSVSDVLFHDARYSVLVARAQNTAGLIKTPQPDPRRPGEQLASSREGVLQSAERVDFDVPRPHIAGLL